MPKTKRKQRSKPKTHRNSGTLSGPKRFLYQRPHRKHRFHNPCCRTSFQGSGMRCINHHNCTRTTQQPRRHAPTQCVYPKTKRHYARRWSAIRRYVPKLLYWLEDTKYKAQSRRRGSGAVRQARASPAYQLSTEPNLSDEAASEPHLGDEAAAP